METIPRFSGALSNGTDPPPPHVRLNLLELESRIVPSWWEVTAPTISVGIAGDTAATHTGSLGLNPQYTSHNGSVQVWADTPKEAVTQALVGTITVTLNGTSYDQVFNMANVGSMADGKAFAVELDGGSVIIHFEDMVNFPGATPDMDYNDRSFTSSSSSGIGREDEVCIDAPPPIDDPPPPIKVEIAPFDFVLVNANNNNYVPKYDENDVWINKNDQWQAPLTSFIPKIRDYEVLTKTAKADPDLLVVSFVVDHNWSGTLSGWVDGVEGGGEARLWIDNFKEDGLFSSKPLLVPPGCEGKPGGFVKSRVNVLIEGLKNSAKMDDITIHASFTYSTPLGSFTVFAPNEQATVGPVVERFQLKASGITPHKDVKGTVIGIATGDQGNDGDAPGHLKKGLVISGGLQTGGLPGNGRFVQVVREIENGTPSFKLKNGDMYEYKLPIDKLPDLFGFPINDSPSSQAPYPYYPSAPIAVPEPNPSGLTIITTEDTPGLNPINDKGKSVATELNPLVSTDITFYARDYLVWQYTDGSLYTVAILDWKSVFKGTTPAGGVFTIDNNSKTTVESPMGTYERTDEDPDKLYGPTYNEILPLAYHKI